MYVIESRMWEYHPNSEEEVFGLFAKRATVIAQCEPKTKKWVASNPQLKAPQPLPPPLTSAGAPSETTASQDWAPLEIVIQNMKGLKRPHRLGHTVGHPL